VTAPVRRWPVVAVIGGGRAPEDVEAVAEAVGALVVDAGAALLTGGRGGVMAAASRGAVRARGAARLPPVLGVLPTYDRSDANAFVDLVLPTGLGHARNAVVVASADVVVAIGGESGTLSELALARKLGRPVVVVAGTGGVSDRVARLLPGVEVADGVDELGEWLSVSLG